MAEVDLSTFVRRRNGVPLGAPGSLGNMLRNAFGASTLQRFWQYWNPIWGFYLSRNVYRPLAALLPATAARILTFAVSGAVHDVAGTVLTLRPLFFLTPWFTLIAIGIELGRLVRLDFRRFGFWQRAVCHTAFLAGTFLLTRALMGVALNL